MSRSAAGIDAHQGWVTLPTGARIFYERAGRGDPVLLLHGVASSTRVWRHILPRLADHNDVIAVDLPGCGRSHKPDTDYSVGTQTASIRYVLDDLGVDLATVIGHSFGGALALSFAYHYPERVGRLGLIDSAGLGREMHLILRLATMPVLPRYLLGLLSTERTRRVRHLLRLALERAWRAIVPRHRMWLLKNIVDLLGSFEDVAVRRAFFGMLCSGSRISGQAVSALDRLGMCLFPVLIVWGRMDPIFPPEHGRRAAALVEHAELAIIDGCGHFPQLETPDLLGSILERWLRSTAPERLDLAALRERVKAEADGAGLRR